MTGLIIFIHLVVCFALILIVLLQSGKGASMGAMFGGAGNQTLFGNTGASTFLTKATTAAAVIFMITSLLLAYATKDVGSSVVSGYKPVHQGSMPIQMPMNAKSQKATSGVKTTPPPAPAKAAPAPATNAAPAGNEAQPAPTGKPDAKTQ